MTGEGQNRPLPLGDRKRAQIAARYEKDRQLAASQPLPEDEFARPTATGELEPYLTAGEVLGLIAYGRPDGFERPAPGAPPMYERWGGIPARSRCERRSSIIFEMRWVLARVRWWLTCDRRSGKWRKCPLPPLDRNARAKLRMIARRHGNEMSVLLAQLRADIRLIQTAYAAHEEELARATTKLCKSIAAKRLVALGRRGTRRGRVLQAGMHEAIPPEYFANPHNTITLDGWATCDPDAPIEEWLHVDRPEWGDVRFETARVLTLWRPQRPGEMAAATTIAAETRLQRWLTEQMNANPASPRSKTAMKVEAVAAGHGFGDRSFQRAWDNAVRESGADTWSAPGRKSSRRIDTRL